MTNENESTEPKKLKRPMSGLINSEGFLAYAYNLEESENLTSTNDMLIEAGKAGAKSGTIVLSKYQSAGKGSKGRSFFCSPEKGFYFSLLIRPGSKVNASIEDEDFRDVPICPALKDEDIPLITPAVACVVADAIEKLDLTVFGYQARTIGIKWVNDLYVDGKKVGGILTESAVDAAGDRFYVIGIGVNLLPPEGGFPEDIANTATYLYEPSKKDGLYDKANNILLFEFLLENFRKYFYQIPNRQFLSEYRRRSILTGQPVTVTPVNGEPYEAKAVRIDDNARLVVEIALNTEDVSVNHKTEIIDLSDRMKAE